MFSKSPYVDNGKKAKKWPKIGSIWNIFDIFHFWVFLVVIFSAWDPLFSRFLDKKNDIFNDIRAKEISKWKMLKSKKSSFLIFHFFPVPRSSPVPENPGTGKSKKPVFARLENGVFFIFVQYQDHLQYQKIPALEKVKTLFLPVSKPSPTGITKKSWYLATEKKNFKTRFLPVSCTVEKWVFYYYRLALKKKLIPTGDPSPLEIRSRNFSWFFAWGEPPSITMARPREVDALRPGQPLTLA